MHPNRRRKKRPNYGIRTVEVTRGPNGFGFTISGQQPCILSCIVANSPAEQAGLRAGDFLISVNGISVSKITHDAVVNLIGNSVGPIKMTIAENYYSDSSDEDVDQSRIVNSRKPKYTHKPRIHRNKYELRSTAADVLLLDNPNKKVLKLRDCSVNHIAHDVRVNSSINGDEATNVSNDFNASNVIPMEDEGGPIEFKSIVGYLGTIEMPKQLLPNSRLQTVCSCIRKLRQEKRSPTSVLMTILPTCLTLKNASNHILAIYPTNRVVYISSSTDKDSRYFGLVTSAVCDNRLEKRENSYGNIWECVEKKFCNLDEKPDVAISNSCHVFVTDPKLTDHSLHIQKADHFKITCTTDILTGQCLEFPCNALYIVSLVQNMYRLQSTDFDAAKCGQKYMHNDELIANSPQPSASSNSDSGIGFRDDCGNISDRILVVEFPTHRPLPILTQNNKRRTNIIASNISLEHLDLPLNEDSSNYNLNNYLDKNVNFTCQNNLNKTEFYEENKVSNLNNIRACENKNTEKPDGEYSVKHHNELGHEIDNYGKLSNRLTVRAMPDPKSVKIDATPKIEYTRNADIDTGQIFTERAVDVPDNSSPSKKSFETISLHSIGDEAFDFKSSIDNISMHSGKSIELNTLKAVFKAPKMLLEKRKSSKRQLKMVSSCDNLVPSKYDASVSNYKLSPKVFGVSKPNHSCEELNVVDVEKFGFGSLQNLCSTWKGNGEERSILAQSEPDVRLQRNEQQSSTSDLRVSQMCFLRLMIWEAA